MMARINMAGCLARREPNDALGRLGGAMGSPARRRQAVRAMAAAALFVIASLTMTGRAGAHASLVSADPAPDSTVQVAPELLTLNFDEAVGGSRRKSRRDGSGGSSRPLGRGFLHGVVAGVVRGRALDQRRLALPAPK